MKKTKILIATGMFFFAGMMFTSCGPEGTETQEQTAGQQEVYQCPMDCEGGKTYDHEGQCPLCEMDLEKIDA